MKGKVAPTKSTTKAYFSFCLSLSAVVLPALYRFLYRRWNKRNYSTWWNVFYFFSKKNFLSKTFLAECVRSGAASCNKRQDHFARNSHTSVASDWTLIHFSHTWKNIVSDSDWMYHFFPSGFVKTWLKKFQVRFNYLTSKWNGKLNNDSIIASNRR